MKLKRTEVVAFFESYFNTGMKEILEELHLNQGLFRQGLIDKFNEILKESGYDNKIGEKWLYNKLSEYNVERKVFNHKEQIKDALKKRWDDPEQRKSFSERNRKNWENDEYRATMSQRASEFNNRPEVKESHSKRMRKLWEQGKFVGLSSIMTERVSELWKNSEYREHMIALFKERGKRLYEENPEELRKRLVAPRRGTKIEKFVESLLKELDVDFTSQKVIKLDGHYMIPDFLFDSQKKIIEVNGDYWHVNPENNYKTLTKSQEETLVRDSIKYEAYKNNGIKFMVIWEKEIKNNPLFVKEKIKKFLEG